ncbi:hypothetical protein MAH1_04960 [Sessilibacter sp. MAH1]
MDEFISKTTSSSLSPYVVNKPTCSDQGGNRLQQMYKNFGVQTSFNGDYGKKSLTLSYNRMSKLEEYKRKGVLR